MAETLSGVSQSSLLLRPKIEPFLCHGCSNSNITYISSKTVGIQRGRLQLGLPKKSITLLPLRVDQKCISVRFSSESKASDILSFDAAIRKPTDVEPDTGGGGSGGGFGDQGGSGGDNGGDNNRNEDEGRDEGEWNKNKKQMILTMSQKLTLGYAVLVGGT